MGECLLFAIRTCVGPELYSQAAHYGWVKIYSRVLSTIVPVVVHFEMTNKESAQKIWENRQSFMRANLLQSTTPAPEVAAAKDPNSPTREVSLDRGQHENVETSLAIKTIAINTAQNSDDEGKMFAVTA